MQKLEGRTFNVVQDNIEKLKELFPEVFTENKVDITKLRLALGENVEKEKERYEFTWNGKTQAIQLAQKQTTGTLRPCKEESVNWDTTQNLYIEGDNLEVLRILQNSYRNKVKMINIDPPYNTGQDFIYNDSFQDNILNYKTKIDENLKSNPETNGRYHTDWLNMIYPRLKIARNLLSDDGVLFISIDENEYSNLKKVLDDIFGEENFIDSIVWKKRYGGGAKEKYLVTVHEQILFYAKDKSAISEILVPLSKEDIKRYYKSKDSNFEIRGPYRTHPLEATKSVGERKNLIFPIPGPNGEEILPKKQWWWDKERVMNALEKGELEFVKSKTGDYTVHTKQYLRDENGVIRKTKAQSIIDDVFTQHGTKEIEELFGDSTIFTFPKPTNLIKKLLYISDVKSDEIVMDFFSGSATTAHSVMSLNSKDEGKRRFIMVQLPELTDEKSSAYKAGYKNICEIGKDRIRRVGTKILEENENNHKIENLYIGFKVFKLDETNLKVWDEESMNLEKDLLDLVEPVKEGRTQEDVVYEILLKYGIDLTVPIEETKIAGKTLFSVGMGYLLICLERDLTLEHIEEMAKQKPARIVFYDEGFKDDTVRTNAQQILKRYGVEDIRVI